MRIQLSIFEATENILFPHLCTSVEVMGASLSAATSADVKAS